VAAVKDRRKLVDASGRQVTLEAELGRGGEGAVFEVAGASDVVAKLYHQPPDRDKAAKLAAMARGTTPALLEVAAWPTATLHERAGGPVVGLTMPRSTGAEVHRLYSPAHRKAEFPNYDWEKLIVVARNTAAAIARIHHAGHVVGDVNQGNVVITPSGRVKLIDCDSFQIRDGTTWRLCEVGVAHFTPPELQGKSFRGVVRTPNHDAFGLAVLIFHLLFMGRHPFAGRFAGRGDMPLEKAITEYRFAFGREAALRQMAPPPNALTLNAASASVAECFERAFGTSGASRDARPSAARWVEILDSLRSELATCQTSKAHRYHRSLGSLCPWCAIEHSGGPDFFVSVSAAIRVAAGGFDLAAIWNQIEQVPSPKSTPVAALATPTVSATMPVARTARWLWRGHRVLRWAAAIVALLAFSGALPSSWWFAVVGGLLVSTVLRQRSGLAEAIAVRDQAVRAAKQSFEELQRQYDRELSQATSAFDAHRRALGELRAEYLQLDAKRRAERKQLETQREAMQRKRFLERYYIDLAMLKGIGPTLKATLASYGIETAADISARTVGSVPGFGPQRVSTLLSWQKSVAAGFRFDPTKGVDPSDIRSIAQRYERRGREIESILSSGPSELRRLAGRVTQLADRAKGELQKSQQALAIATANRHAAG
jgi:DNA-binding helix-hairpin-helix protein with protein kinase domain